MPQLINLLSDGECHSGEELGLVLGISRAAVWKRVETLRKSGVAIDAVAGRGYKLRAPLAGWSRDKLLFLMGKQAAALIDSLEVENVVTSTNDVVTQAMRGRRGPGAVICLAEVQTAGRGRRGRSWCSPIGSNFYGSIGWRFESGASLLEGLSLAVGVAVVRALKRYGVEHACLKWPNDIMVGRAKLGGILIEAQAESGGPCLVVIGVGVNLLASGELARQVSQSVTDVAAHLEFLPNKNEFGALVLEEILMLLASYEKTGFAAVREEWRASDALYGREVVVMGFGREIIGTAQGVDERGALLVLAGGELISVFGGEVSVRGLA